MTSQEHQNLVDALVKAFIAEGFTIETADSGSYTRPSAIGRHEPDIVARDRNGLIIIGEAKNGLWGACPAGTTTTASPSCVNRKHRQRLMRD